MPQFLQTGNHREHNFHISDRARAQDRAQLCFKDVDVLQTETNGAPAEERIQLIAHIDCADGKFVATEIEGANDERVWFDLLSDFSIRFVLLLFARQRIAIHEKKFSPVKSDSFGAVFRDRLNVARKLDIRRKNNMAPVAGGRCGLAKSSQFFRDQAFSKLNLAVVRKCFRRWIDNQQAGVAVEQDVLTSFKFFGGVVQTNDCRNVERPRDDRGVRRATSQISRDAEHELTIHRCRVRWCEIVRDQNVRFPGGGNWFRRLTLQISNNAASYVLNIECAFAQVRVVDLAQRFGIIAAHFLKNPFDIAAFRFQPAQNFVNQSPVFDHEQVRVENRGIFGADRFRDFLLHFEDLNARLDEGGFKAGNFVSNLRRLDLITGDVVEIVAHHMNDAVGKPRRDARSLKPDFLVIAAHPRAIL